MEVQVASYSTERLSWADTLGPVALSILAVGLTLWWTSEIGLIGTDTFPYIASSRVSGAQELVALLGKDIFRVEGSQAKFYRPVVNLTFAADYALWRLHPFGYQLTNALIFGLCGWALALLARRLAGPQARVVVWIVPLVFFLHPSHAELLPVAPRRQETLCCLFLALALACQLSRRPGPWPRAALVAALTSLAIGAKETALLAPGLGFVAGLCSDSTQALRTRVSSAMKATVPHWVAVFLMLSVRFKVLGGLGGHIPIEVSGPDAWRRLPWIGGLVCRGLLAPQRMDPNYIVPLALFCAGSVAAVVVMVHDWARPSPRPRRGVAASHPAHLALIGAAWVVLVIAVYAITGLLQPWHLLLVTAGWAMLWGAIAETAFVGLRARGLGAGAAGLVALLALGGVVGWQARDSPLFVKYPEYRRLTNMSESYLSRLYRRIAETANGHTVDAGRLPFWRIPPTPGRATVFAATCLSKYSLRAWLNVRFPERKTRIESVRAASARADRDEIVVLLR